ncbi:MAG: pyrimidine 5'-nucleotidase [Sulfuricella sp.]|nr:pyrimidine 5'-nucleotidase [Sulfuricella sp.]
MKRHPVWLFDLDNTLHDANRAIFPHINRLMTDYLKTHLALDENQADALRVAYWQRYGATLVGLVRHHQVAPNHFLWHTHQFSDLPAMVHAESTLGHTLRRLKGRKVLFSNAPAHYSLRVLNILGIADCFDEIFCIEHLGYAPKPAPAGFRKVLARLRVRPQDCVMVEDSPENLRTARRFGIKTVLIGKGCQRPAHVDVKIRSLRELPGTVA